ncbi:MAG: division/cell wall cluster transcriptional repressor MraZ [Pseudomonadota bacterium]
MGLFLSTSKHKIDRKGRVSVPAPFRAALEGESFKGVALALPLSDEPCLEGSGLSRIARIARSLSAMNPLAAERDALATALLAGVTQAAFDAEGRIVLPEELIAAADLEGEALFAGLGDKFQIWRPDRFEARRAEARAVARRMADKLPWGGAADLGGGADEREGGAGDRE